MKNVKMSYKLMILVLAAGILPLIVGILFTYNIAKSELQDSVRNTNETFSNLTNQNLSTFFTERMGDGIVLASIGDVVNGLEVFLIKRQMAVKQTKLENHLILLLPM